MLRDAEFLSASTVSALLDPRLRGHAVHVAPVAPDSLDPRLRGHAVHVAPIAPASLDLRLQGHAALSLHHTIFETLMHSIVSARGR